MKNAIFLLSVPALALSLGCSSDDLSVELTYGTDAFQRDQALNVENISAHDEARSHNQGLNCMECHQQHGPGRGLFTIAGTPADAEGRWLKNPVVELHTAPEDGELVLRVEGDSLGNFFSTEELPFPEQELFVRIRSEDGTLSNQMPFPTTSGTCNHCHTGGFHITALPQKESD